MRCVTKRFGLLLPVLAVVALASLIPNAALAANMYWLQGSAGGGSGTWDSTTSNWSATDGGPTTTWVDGSDVYLEGAAGTATIANAYVPAVNSLNFVTSGYSISQGPATGGGSLTMSTTTGTINVPTGVSGSLNTQIVDSPTLGSISVLVTGGGSLTAAVGNGSLITGALTIDGATVLDGSGNEFQHVSGVTIQNGGRFDISNGEFFPCAVTLANGSLTSSSAGGNTMKSLVSQGGYISAALYLYENSVAGAITVNGPGTTTIAKASTYNGPVNIEGGTLALTVASALYKNSQITVDNGSVLSLSTFGGTIAGITLNSGSITGTGTLTCGTNSTASNHFTVYSGSISANLAGTKNYQTLTKLGTGTVILSGTNTYAGSITTVSAGTLQFSKTAALPYFSTSASSVTVQSGATMAVNAGGSGEWTDANITSLLGFSHVVFNSGSALGIDTSDATGGSFTFSGALTAAGVGLTKLGSNTLVLSGANTYSGPTTVSAGVLNIPNNTVMGTSGVSVASGAALQLQGGLTSVSNALTLNGLGVSNDGALRSVSGANTYAGLITLGNNARINNDDTANTFTVSNVGTITGSGFGLTVGGAGNTTIASIIGTGAGTFTKDGAGRVYLTGANTYGGLTTVNGGVLELAAAAQSVTGGANIEKGQLIFDYPDVASSIAAAMQASYNGGLWTGGPFQCTTQDSQHGLGWMDTGSNVIVMYTLYGDANLDGTVNGGDLNTVLSNFQQTGMTWAQGDFNYDGTVNGGDLNTVLSNFQQHLSVTGAVPEPSSLLLTAAGLASLLAYAWRKRK